MLRRGQVELIGGLLVCNTNSADRLRSITLLWEDGRVIDHADKDSNEKDCPTIFLSLKLKFQNVIRNIFRFGRMFCNFLVQK